MATTNEALEQPTNMVTIPLDKLEDMQRRLKEQTTAEHSLTYEDGFAHGYEAKLKEKNT